MKITIAYSIDEAQEAARLAQTLAAQFPGSRRHEKEQYTPYSHIYLATRRPKKALEVKKKP